MAFCPLHKELHILKQAKQGDSCNGSPKLPGMLFFWRACNCFMGDFARLCTAKQLLVPIFDYDDRVNRRARLSFLNELAVPHNRAVRFVLNCSFGSHHCEMLSSLNWRPLSQGRELDGFKMVRCQFMGVLRRALKPPPTRAGWELNVRGERVFCFKDTGEKIFVSIGFFLNMLINHWPTGVSSVLTDAAVNC